jgi:tetratricopeptide (TPR) repeat protein
LLGTGAGSYDVLFEKYRPEGFGDHTLWAHNDYLNTLSDYGVVGFALFFGACAIVSVRAARIRRDENVRRRDWLDSPTVLPALGMGLLAFALHLGVEFHFKVPALGLVVATVGAIAVSRAWPAPARSPERASSVRWWPGLVAAGCAAGYLFVLLPHFRGENLRRPARDLIDGLAALPVDPAHYRAPLEQASAALARATSLDPANGQAWADLAYATILRAHVETDHDVLLGQEAERAAERALGCSRACNEFWIRRGVARDLQGRWLEASDDFVKALELAPSSAAAWYYFAYHLSLNPAERRYADAVLETCLRLDPWSPYGLALRQRLATGQKVP